MLSSELWSPEKERWQTLLRQRHLHITSAALQTERQNYFVQTVEPCVKAHIS